MSVNAFRFNRPLSDYIRSLNKHDDIDRTRTDNKIIRTIIQEQKGIIQTRIHISLDENCHRGDTTRDSSHGMYEPHSIIIPWLIASTIDKRVPCRVNVGYYLNELLATIHSLHAREGARFNFCFRFILLDRYFSHHDSIPLPSPCRTPLLSPLQSEFDDQF